MDIPTHARTAGTGLPQVKKLQEDLCWINPHSPPPPPSDPITQGSELNWASLSLRTLLVSWTCTYVCLLACLCECFARNMFVCLLAPIYKHSAQNMSIFPLVCPNEHCMSWTCLSLCTLSQDTLVCLLICLYKYCNVLNKFVCLLIHHYEYC